MTKEQIKARIDATLYSWRNSTDPRSIEQVVYDLHMQLAVESMPRARRADPEPSHIGASFPQKGNRKLVLDQVIAAGPGGLTASELEGPEESVRKGLHRRLVELERGGHIHRNGTRKGLTGVPNTIWVASGMKLPCVAA